MISQHGNFLYRNLNKVFSSSSQSLSFYSWAVVKEKIPNEDDVSQSNFLIAVCAFEGRNYILLLSTCSLSLNIKN